jgi:hypothetical protein
MAISLLSDVMGRGEKLQLAMSGCRDDTGCIEIIAGCAAGQKKAPDRSGAFCGSGVQVRTTPAAAHPA